jgi:acetyl-CoA synthetase (ADP-forming)
VNRDLTPLFEPRGIVVTGVSDHPGKFGFVTLHNILTAGFEGDVYAVGREAGRVLGHPVLGSIAEIPTGGADLAFVCTPRALNEDVLTAVAERGVKAVFVAAAGYREAGPEGAEAEIRLVALADDLDLVLAGPNGQGIVSTPVGLCAQIVAPYAPRGPIAIASQSGNLVSSLLNLADHHGIGVSRSVAAGNAAQVGIVDYLEWFTDDPETAVSLVYVEDVDDGRAMYERLRPLAERKPIVVVKGGASDAGARAAASHTGAMATDDAVFTGMARQSGLVRARDVEEAYEVAATLATQPLTRGDRVVVVTTVGGWGVAAVDAMAGTRLDPVELPDDLRAAVDTKLPPRWSRANPVDMAGGETRDTVPEVLELVAGHPGVDAVVFLGIGIQSNTAAMMRSGPFYPNHGLERIVGFHERQDARYAEAAADISRRTGTPILVATELATAHPENPGPSTVRAGGRLCHASAGRAVRSLDLMAQRAAWLTRRSIDR